ncbi:hypothetical protein [Rhodococcus sp. 1139]|uniref:hypothetical protein n=1 Tax=Rhodococcus sp. 1139 TaxID=1833762 RepID=UPI000872FC78|nr:hypothetical protein [Rhodococcus sp. 1139]OFE08234.1 hypothetical protein A5N83_13780 [Rhodococcus sp. 1139]
MPDEAQERRGDASLQILLLLAFSTAQERSGRVWIDFYDLFAQGGSYRRLPLLDDHVAVQREKVNKRLCEFGLGDRPIVIDVQTREKPLVEHATFLRMRCFVVAVAVLRDAERTFDGVNNLRTRLHGSGDDLFIGVQFTRQSVHLGFEHVQRYRSGIVGLKQLRAFTLDLHEFAIRCAQTLVDPCSLCL